MHTEKTEPSYAPIGENSRRAFKAIQLPLLGMSKLDLYLQHKHLRSFKYCQLCLHVNKVDNHLQSLIYSDLRTSFINHM
jgi:hypothetical protein